MALEIIERQSQQPAEQMQIELGVEPRPDHRNDRPPGICERSIDRLRQPRTCAAQFAREDFRNLTMADVERQAEEMPWGTAACIRRASRSPFCRTSVARLASTTLPASISNP